MIIWELKLLPLKTDISPDKWCLDDYFPFETVPVHANFHFGVSNDTGFDNPWLPSPPHTLSNLVGVYGKKRHQKLAPGTLVEPVLNSSYHYHKKNAALAAKSLRYRPWAIAEGQESAD